MTPSHSGARPRLILVGNAPIRWNLGAFVDSCDLIIRCNDAKSLGGNAGNRTHVLCLDSTGTVETNRFCRETRLQSRSRFPEWKEVWFSKPSSDVSTAILQNNGLEHLPAYFVSEAMRQQMEIRLTQVARRPFRMPSTGFCAFWYVLHEERFRDYEKVVTGFSFEVWDGHPQDAERKIIQDVCETHPDFTFLPVAKYWKLERAVRNGFRWIRKRLRRGIKALSDRGIVLYPLKE
jgi:hypothetical protein